MATIAPLFPGLPGLVAPTHKGRRRCAAQVPHGYALTPFLTQEPNPALWDFLTFWYMRVRQDQEQAALWGELGLSPSKFVLTFANVPLLLVHHDSLPWQQGEGLMQVCWLDDIVPGLRARVHHWVHPTYRHPTVSLRLGQMILRYLFTQMGFALLEGRTPVANRGAVRYARRLGFRIVATLPYGEWSWNADGSRTVTAVVQSQLTINEWQATEHETAGEAYGFDV